MGADARGQGPTDSYEMAPHPTYAPGVTPCATPTLSASPVSSGATGASVTFTATTTGCAKPTYRFWVQGPDGRWQVKQDYSTAGSFVWTGTGLVGSYGIEVEDRKSTRLNSSHSQISYAVFC